jgi:hypothetical protein
MSGISCHLMEDGELKDVRNVRLETLIKHRATIRAALGEGCVIDRGIAEELERRGNPKVDS